MLRCRFSFFALLLVPLCALAQPKAPYYPDAVWQRKTPAEAGVNALGLKDAVDYTVANETRNPRDLTLNHYQTSPASAFAHIGNGTNIVYVDPDHDIVAIVRWIERRAIDEFLKRLLAAVG